MTYADWSHLGDSTNVEQDTSTFYEGNASLKFNSSQVDSLEILSQSLNDTPDEAAVRSQYRPGNAEFEYNFGWFSAFLVQDINNFYLHGLAGQTHGIWKCVSGSFTQVDSEDLGGGSGQIDNMQALEDGTTNLVNKWTPWQSQQWFDDTGTLRFRLSEDSTEDGTYTQYGTDLTDSSPEWSNGGVGIGSGEPFGSLRPGVMWFDQTEVYY